MCIIASGKAVVLCRCTCSGQTKRHKWLGVCEMKMLWCCADESALNRLKGMSGFESVEWDMALAGQNPHAIGVAIKAGGDSDEREVDFAQRINKSNRSKKKSVKAGFGKS